MPSPVGDLPGDLPVQILESSEEDILTFDGQDTVPFEVVLDFGAADHVADNADAPGYKLEQSPGSKAGTGFIAANGQRIANRGQMVLSFTSDSGQHINSTFQV